MKTHSQKSIDFAVCPHHRNDGTGRNAGLTGLIALDSKTVAFREHTKRVGKVTVPCPGSGEIYHREGLEG